MSDNYTPTTKEVRDDYRFSNQRPDICGKDFGSEFDRWLAAHDAEVAAKAWDEGFRAGDGVGAYSRRERDEMNPYLGRSES